MKKKKQLHEDKSKRFFFEEIIELLSNHPQSSLNYKQIATKLGISDPIERQLIPAILEELKSKSILTEPKRGKFKIVLQEKYLTGKVDMTTSGTAYILTDEMEEDILVIPRKTLNALHGDTVQVRLLPQKGRGRREGEIIKIVERAKTEFVGVIQLSSNFAFLVPSNNRIHVDIYIPIGKLKGAKNGQKAIAKITEWPKNGVNPIGEIIDVLGDAGNNDTEMHAILAEYGLPYNFPDDVERMADLIPTEINEQEIKKRRDFRHITTFTIDPFDAKDFDDALSIRKLPSGNWEIGIHIADVSHYVKPDSLLDKEAFSRATSVYLVDRVVPMLPEILSNNVCSLRPNEDKLCFSAVFEMNDEAEVIDQWFGRTVINSNKRFTYEEAQQIIETEEGDFKAEILTLNKLAKLLRKVRFSKGSIAFEKMEIKFHLDEVGNPTGVYMKEMKDSNQLIEDFMLLANRKVAEFVGLSKEKNAPKRTFVYRVHDKPNPDKLSAFAEFVGKFGYKMNIGSEKAATDSMNHLLKEVNGKKEANMIEMLAIRTMAKAVYTTKNVGHYGLGFSHYTHFTSPIRRYPDVIVHRLLQHYLDNEKSPDEEPVDEQCKHSSAMEKLAADAERSSIKYKQVQFLIDKVGGEFDGVISGVTEWGIFVEITENHCEGMVRIRELKGDNYYFDEDNYCLRGRKSGNILTLGDAVRIQVKRADLLKKQLDFGLIEISQKKNQEDSFKEKFIKRGKPTEKAGRDYQKESQKPPTSSGNAFKDEWGFDV